MPTARPSASAVRLPHHAPVGRGVERLELPAVGERGADLRLADLWPEAATRVGQREHVQQSAGPERRVQARDVTGPVGVVEKMWNNALSTIVS